MVVLEAKCHSENQFFFSSLDYFKNILHHGKDVCAWSSIRPLKAEVVISEFFPLGT